jgi:hypothetical protein
MQVLLYLRDDDVYDLIDKYIDVMVFVTHHHYQVHYV